jgi:hypothetical protein
MDFPPSHCGRSPEERLRPCFLLLLRFREEVKKGYFREFSRFLPRKSMSPAGAGIIKSLLKSDRYRNSTVNDARGGQLPNG